MSRRILPGAATPRRWPAVCLGHSASRNSMLGMPAHGGAAPADPPKPQDADPLPMRNAPKRRRIKVRRPCRSLAVLVAVSAISMPVALLTSQAAMAAPSASAADRLAAQSQAGVALAITGMTPRQAAPGSTITVTGTLKNTSQQQLSNLAIRLLSSGRVTSVAQIEAGASDPEALADAPVPGASWQTGQVQPGATVPWSIHVKAKAIGMTSFGVYPLVAQAQATQALTDLPLAAAATYLPYIPAKKGPYRSSIPARTKISWVWPLIGQPLLTTPGQNACQAPQAQALAASLGSSGRLGELVAAGANDSHAAITWAIDPALLANVKALTACGSSEPKWAAAADDWLSKIRQLSAAQPVFLTPYGDPDVAALIGAGHSSDVREAFQDGSTIGNKILKRTPSEGTAASRPAAQDETSGIAWPADGIPGDPPGARAGDTGYTVLENLASDGIQTLLLPSSYLPAEHATVVRTPDDGVYMKLLLANDSLTRLLGSGGSSADSVFATTQEFLAETALLAKQNPGQPIVVAPPQRWAPAAQLAASLLAVTDSASWLSPASLASLTSGKNIQIRPLPSGRPHLMLSPREVRVLHRVDSKIAKLELLRARSDPDDYLPVLAAESSAWQDAPGTALSALRALELRIRHQLSQGVQIESEQRFTLGGLKGSVPVSVDNTLSYAVAVRLRPVVTSSQGSGITITVSPGGVVNRSGLVTIPPHNVVTVRLRVQATQVGASTVTLSLENRLGQPLLGSPTQQMTIQATQVGVLGVIIFAVALGIFLIATAARAARRGRAAPAAEQATDPRIAAEHADDGPGEPPEPDTVMAERTQLGAAGAPGRD
jgi:hypothetical protein